MFCSKIKPLKSAGSCYRNGGEHYCVFLYKYSKSTRLNSDAHKISFDLGVLAKKTRTAVWN